MLLINRDLPLPKSDPWPLISLGIDRETSNLVLEANWLILIAAIAIGLLALWLVRKWRDRQIADWEIDEAEIGIGSGKLKLKPNNIDRQIAYSIWVELSTRKIGLQIDPEDDVIAEIYDSWYAFFSVTRELI